jgi:tetratricopeptide (TPR) repeat protein
VSRSRARKSPARVERATPRPLIQGPLADNFWIIGSPLVALAAMAALWKWSGASDLAIYAILFGFIVTGHHLPGWFRAFGEPSVYSRYRARLWTSLAAVPALVILPTAFGLGAVALTVAALFDLWHVAMQQHGFGRIYAAKAGDTQPASARLDLACVLVWYGTAVAWSDPWMQGIARVFRKAGLPVFDLLTPAAWRLVKLVLLAASVALAAAYVHAAWRLWRVRGVTTPRKHLLHLAAFSVIVFSYQLPSWYRAQSVQNLFHALQYFFIVWVYGHLSIRRDPQKPKSFYRALFGSTKGLALFGGCIVVYGVLALALSSSGYRLTGADAERKAQIIGSIGLASLLLHFYVDSFIWKVRSREVRTTLGISENAPAAVSAPAPTVIELREPAARGIAHAVAYFGIPVLLVAMIGARSRTVPPDKELSSLAHETLLFPRSAIGHAAYGQAAINAGQAAVAEKELKTAVDLAPGLEGPALALAALDRSRGESASEIEHARTAVSASPRNAAAHYALANALASARRLDEAETEYREALRLQPGSAGAEENLGVLYKWRGRLDLAIPHFRRAHELDPDLSAAACDLAGALATLGQTQEALTVLADYRARHPQDGVVAGLERAIRADAASRPGS